MKKRSLQAIAAIVVVTTTLGFAWVRDHTRAPAPSLEGAALWTQSIAQLQASDYSNAGKSLSQWISSAEASNIHSPEAHFNLGMVHWNLKETGPAASEVLKSLLVGQSLSHIIHAQSVLAGIQRDLGINDGVAREARFLARIAITDNGLTFLLSLLLWSSAIAAFVLWRQRKSLEWRTALSWVAIPLVVCVLAGAGLASRDWNGGYGILEDTDGIIGLFPSPRIDTQEKLLDLPSGTLVHFTGDTQNGFMQVDSPIIAWVPSTEIDVPTL